jgi:hypothetical protein
MLLIRAVVRVIVEGIAPPTIFLFMLLIPLLEAQHINTSKHASDCTSNPRSAGSGHHTRRTLGVALFEKLIVQYNCLQKRKLPAEKIPTKLFLLLILRSTSMHVVHLCDQFRPFFAPPSPLSPHAPKRSLSNSGHTGATGTFPQKAGGARGGALWPSGTWPR